MKKEIGGAKGDIVFQCQLLIILSILVKHVNQLFNPQSVTL